MFWKRPGLSSLLLIGFGLSSGVTLSQSATTEAGNTQPGPLTGLVPDHATISVENVERVADWYERILGFKVTHRLNNDPGFVLEQLSIPGYRIDLVEYKGSVRPASVDPVFLRQGWIHVVFNVPDLSAALKQLQALNLALTVNKDANGLPTRLVLHDPESNEVEVVRRK